MFDWLQHIFSTVTHSTVIIYPFPSKNLVISFEIEQLVRQHRTKNKHRLSGEKYSGMEKLFDYSGDDISPDPEMIIQYTSVTDTDIEDQDIISNEFGKKLFFGKGLNILFTFVNGRRTSIFLLSNTYLIIM